MLLDSNIVVYAAQPEHSFLHEMMRDRSVFVSVITRVEVLGYHRLMPGERDVLERIFEITYQLPVTAPIIDLAIALRQQRKIGLADSLIAGTALHHALPLVTRNTSDFTWIHGLEVIDPFADNAVKSAGSV